MLVHITNKCGRGCSHCMEDSTPAGQHMTEENFLKSMDFTRRIERLAWAAGCPPYLLISGGECSEHPDFVKWVELAVGQGFYPWILTNGLFLFNEEMRKAVLRPEWKQLSVQVTYDPRFYPEPAPPRVEDERITYIGSLSRYTTLGRAGRKKNLDTKGVQMRHGPSSFNIRSFTRQLGSLEEALVIQRTRAAVGKAGHCSPSILSSGDVVGGETSGCFKIGTVDSSNAELTKAMSEMQCNRCGHENELSPVEKRAIGASMLFSPYET